MWLDMKWHNFQGEYVATEQFRSSARWLHVVFSVSLSDFYISVYSVRASTEWFLVEVCVRWRYVFFRGAKPSNPLWFCERTRTVLGLKRPPVTSSVGFGTGFPLESRRFLSCRVASYGRLEVRQKLTKVRRSGVFFCVLLCIQCVLVLWRLVQFFSYIL